MKTKTSELTGAALDWAVAKCEGEVTEFGSDGITFGFKLNGKLKVFARGWAPSMSWCPSTDWAQSGPIIDRERITVVCAEGDYNRSKAGTPDCYDTYWVADKGRQTSDTVYGPQGDDWGRQFQIEADCITGPTPLIAGMRCYVASKLGDEVDVPEELL
jgi:hypothetical protein